MIEVLKALSVFFAYAVMAVFAQNAVFTRALGVSRLVKLVDDTTVDSLTFGALLCAVQLISAPLGYFVNLWLAQYPYRMYIRPLVMVLCSTVAFFIVLLVVVVFFRLHGARAAHGKSPGLRRRDAPGEAAQAPGSIPRQAAGAAVKMPAYGR